MNEQEEYLRNNLEEHMKNTVSSDMTVSTYLGCPINSKLSKNALLGIIKELYKMIQREREDSKHYMDTMHNLRGG